MQVNELEKNIQIAKDIDTSNKEPNIEVNVKTIKNNLENIDIDIKRNSKSLSNKYNSNQNNNNNNKMGMQNINDEPFNYDDEEFYRMNRPRMNTHNDEIGKNEKIKKRKHIRKKRRKTTIEQNNERNLCMGCVGCNIF